MTSFTSRIEPPLDQPYPGAPIGAAFRRFWKKGFTFEGRASRSEYWKAYLLTAGIFIALYLASTLISTIGLTAAMSSGNYNSLGAVSNVSVLLLILSVVYGLAIAIPSIAAAVRRLHDTDQSGAAYFFAFIPFVGGIILLVMLAQPAKFGGGRFDRPVAAQKSTPHAQTPPPPPPPPAPAFGASSTFGVPSGFGGGSAVPPPPPPPSTEIDDRTFVPHAPSGAFSARAATPSGPITAIPGAVPRRQGPDFPAAAAGLDETRLTAPVVDAAWVLALPDGRALPVVEAIYLGRDPIAAPEHPYAVRVPIDDPAKSMSKTHARIVPNGAALEVTDLHSTNGTRIVRDGLPSVSVSPGVAHPVPAGASISLGDYVVTLRRNG